MLTAALRSLRSLRSLYTVTFQTSEGNYHRAEATFEKVGQARKLAAGLAERFSDVVVWQGQPGGIRA